MSIAVHAAAVLAFALALGAGHQHRHDAPLAPTRLVWIEPARGMVPAQPARGSAPAPAAAAPDAQSPPSAPAASEPAPVPLAKKPEPAPVPRLARRSELRPAPTKPRDLPSAAPAPEQRDVDTAPATAPAVGGNGEAAKGVAEGAPAGLGDAPLRLSSVATPPELVERIVPEYPSRARALEIEGQVLLEVVLDRNGRPEAGIRVLRSVSMLDAAAVAAVRQWRFRPARDADGHAVRVIMEVPVRFVLR
ncbi:MAG: TonB family protein [Candidatus Binatia bacterium]